ESDDSKVLIPNREGEGRVSIAINQRWPSIILRHEEFTYRMALEKHCQMEWRAVESIRVTNICTLINQILSKTRGIEDYSVVKSSTAKRVVAHEVNTVQIEVGERNIFVKGEVEA